MRVDFVKYVGSEVLTRVVMIVAIFWNKGMISPKHWFIYGLHGAISQKMATFLHFLLMYVLFPELCFNLYTHVFR
jgi:hypothetical protein